MSAWYSATLLVATPIVSDTVPITRGGSSEASRTTAPTAAGPGFPPRTAVAEDADRPPPGVEAR